MEFCQQLSQLLCLFICVKWENCNIIGTSKSKGCLEEENEQNYGSWLLDNSIGSTTNNSEGLETIMENATNWTDKRALGLPPGLYIALDSILLIAITLPSLVMNGLALLALVVDKATIRSMKIVSGALLAGAIVFGVATLVWRVGHVSRGLGLHTESGTYSLSCRLPLFVIFAMLYGRFAFTATYSVVMFLYVRKGQNGVNNVALLGSIAITGFAMLVVNVPILLEDTYAEEGYLDDVVCGLIAASPVAYIHASVFWCVIAISSFIVTIVFSALTYHGVRKSIFTAEGQTVGIAMIKFSACLIALNAINFMTAFLPAIILIAPDDIKVVRIAISYSLYGIMDATILLQAIIMICVFRPLHSSMTTMFRRMCKKLNSVYESICQTLCGFIIINIDLSDHFDDVNSGSNTQMYNSEIYS